MFTCAKSLRLEIEKIIPFPFGLSLIRSDQKFIEVITPLIGDENLSSRKVDFWAGRYGANKALSQLNAKADFPLPISPEGAPVWPKGFSGSITHKQDIAIAVVTEESFARGVGIDLEHIDLSDSALKKRVFTPSELMQFESVKLDDNQLSAMGFSIKEAYFKSLSPQLQSRDLDFKEMEIELNQYAPSSQILLFTVKLLTDRFPEFINHVAHGGVLISQSNILTVAHYK